ncbi:MAG: hypothetical protein O3A20_10320 [Planctomycetota bacterium]|nr:hypothetical protein [Planctomycetota bacterium]
MLATESNKWDCNGLWMMSRFDAPDGSFSGRGIGVWTAQMYLMFKLGRPDVMPSTDLGVQEGAKRIYRLDARPSPKELERIGAAWAPLRSVGAWACWRAVDDPGAGEGLLT